MSFNFSQEPLNNDSALLLNIDKALDNVWSLINQQNVPQAKKACSELNQSHPNNADAWYASSFLAFQLKQFDQALIYIGKAIELEPQNLQWLLHKAHSLLLYGELTSAHIIVEQLVNSPKFNENNKINNFAEIALILNALEEFKTAAFYYKKAIDLQPEQNTQKAQLYFNLASIQRYLGEIDAAEESLTRAITYNPHDFEAYLLRSSLKNQTTLANHVAELDNLIIQGIKHPIAKAQIFYALAKEHEDLASEKNNKDSANNYQKSFNYLVEGAKSRRKNMRYDVAQDVKTINEIVTTFNQSYVEQQTANNNTGCENAEAIFILGLPRTGSTLVERIVSSHTDVQSAGELNNFAIQLMAQARHYCNDKKVKPPQNKAELVSLSSKLNFAKLGQAYIDSTRKSANFSTGKSKHFIDKLPLNSLYSGLIHLALPKAKIIHITRHPLDTCYAIYKQLFTQGYPFSYDLNELAQYYIAHHKMMLHWEKTLSGHIYKVAYEDVINNVEEQAKALIRYCNLDWQEQCLGFNHNKTPSTTASATQVRKGIYKSSQGKWQNYSQQLTPLKEQLELAGICCD